MAPDALVRDSPVSLATNPRNGEAGDGPQLMMWVLDPVVTRQQLTVKGGWHIRPEGSAWRWGYLSSMCQLGQSEVPKSLHVNTLGLGCDGRLKNSEILAHNTLHSGVPASPGI